MTRRRQEEPDLIALIEALELPYEPLMFAYPVFVSGPGPEGFAMLPELPPAHAPLMLRVYRAVWAWVRGPRVALAVLTPERMDPWERKVLVDGYVSAQEDAPDTELVIHLAVIVSELRRPDVASSEEVAVRCLNVSDWALGKGMRETGMAFAELAALSWPSHGRYAWIAGKVFRSYGRMREAEAWLLRASRLATWYKDWEAKALSLSSLGNLYWEQGVYTRAESMYLGALGIAQRHRLRAVEAEVSHDLFIARYIGGDYRGAEKYAHRALLLYGPKHPRIPKFAHDIATFWLAQGFFCRALTVLDPLLARFDQPEDRLRIVASAAHASGACGRKEAFERFWIEIWELVQRLSDAPGIAAALTEVGLGASHLGLWDHACEALERALIEAHTREEVDVIAKAGVALDAVRDRQDPEKIVQQSLEVNLNRPADKFAQELIRYLST